MKNEDTKNAPGIANAIGDMGGTQAAPGGIGGKLRRVPGQQAELTEEEKNEFAAFQQRAKIASQQRRAALEEKHDETPIHSAEGWIPIDRATMGIRSTFYPEDWQFFVRPATVAAIKNWSTVDDDRIDVINTVFNDIIRECVRITSASGNIPWSRINSWDRFWFIIKVREYSFERGESKLEFEDECTECGESITFELTPDNLYYSFPDEEVVRKHWDSASRSWTINPADYDVEGAEIVFYVPTLEKDQAILDWAVTKARANANWTPNRAFMKFLPYMLAKAPKDKAAFTHLVDSAYKEFESWNDEYFDFMDEVVNNLSVNPSEQLRTICSHCGEEVVSNVRFPNGVKYLFKPVTQRKKFGSR